MQILENIGIQVGHVIERKRLEKAIDVATTALQRHVAQELHDTVAQELSGMSLIAESLRKAIVAGTARPEQAEELARHLEESNELVRQLSHGLMPVEVETGALFPALEQLARQCCKLHTIECRVTGEANLDLRSADTATHLYRIAQEAVQNAVKHGKPTRVEISLRQEGADVVLQIQDDGGGFPPNAEPKGGIGRQVMKHRASLVGGHLVLLSEPGVGVTVICRVKENDPVGV